MSDILNFLESSREKIQRAYGILQGIDDVIDRAVRETETPLSDDQIALARSIFGNSINYDEVIINDSSALAEANQHLPDNNSSRPFVWGNTINSSEPLSDEDFIHEMMHIHQYQTQGWSYLPDALINGEYDYDSKDLREYSQNSDYEGKRLQQFGPEQQAEIVKDYFTLSQKSMVRPFLPFEFNGEEIDGSNIDEYMEIYQPYINEIQESRPLEGVHKEINEGIEETTREVGEGVEDMTREAREGDVGGVGREFHETSSNVATELFEGAGETILEFTGLGGIFGNNEITGSINLDND